MLYSVLLWRLFAGAPWRDPAAALPERRRALTITGLLVLPVGTAPAPAGLPCLALAGRPACVDVA